MSVPEKVEPQPVEIIDDHVTPVIVKVRGRDGIVRDYVCCENEGSEQFWDWYDRLQKGYARVQKGEVFNITHLHEEIILMCVRVNGEPVTKDMVSNLGIRAKRKLFDACLQVNVVTETEIVKEGKDSGDEALIGGGSSSPSN